MALSSRGEALRQRRQLVIVRGEEGARAVRLVQVLDRRPGDGEAVEGRGAAADLVEDDQRALGRLVQDGGGLDHLDHEGRSSPREIVGGADAAEQAVDDADMGALRRHIAADLRQHGDQRVLAQEGRLAGHVRAGHQPDMAGVGGVVAERAVVRDEGAAGCLQRLLDDGMAAALDGEGERGGRRSAATSSHLQRATAKAGGDVEAGQRLGDGADRRLLGRAPRNVGRRTRRARGRAPARRPRRSAPRARRARW